MSKSTKSSAKVATVRKPDPKLSKIARTAALAYWANRKALEAKASRKSRKAA